jgi:hypothetical protein
MAFRRNANRHDHWLRAVHEHAGLLRDLPQAALANEAVFRDYLTRGEHEGVKLHPSVFELSRNALEDLWVFVNHEMQFDMDCVLFDDFNLAVRSHQPGPN